MARKAAAAQADVAEGGAVTLASLAAELAKVTARLEALEERLAPAVAVAPPAAAAAPVLEAAPPERIAQDPLAEAQALLRALFSVALAPESDVEGESRFERFRDLVHSMRKGTPLLDRELNSYKWQPFSGRYAQYLQVPGDPSSFKITQMVPDPITEHTELVKIFLKADKRMPPRLSLRRDERAGGAFRIDGSSL